MKKVWALLLVGVVISSGGAFFVFRPQVLSAFAAPTIADVGGTRATLEVEAGSEADAVKAVLERRLDSMGWHSASVRADGEGRLVVEVPGVFDTDMVARVVGTRGALAFRLVDPDASDVAPRVQQADGSMPPLALERKAWITGEDLVDAQPGFDQQGQQPIVNFRFDKIGTETFAKVTSHNVGRAVAIVLDDKVLSAPRILSPIMGGAGQISGNFTTEQARELATLLRAGSLPAGIKVVSVEEVKGKR